MSIGINDDIEKIKALEDNILDQYNKNVELADKMEQETEKFAKQANTAIEDYNSNAETKAEEFNTNAKEKTDEFNSNATEKETEISDIADGFDANVEEKTNTFNSNVETKTTEFNNNSNTKTEEFNNNSTEKINAFNSNAEEKIADYNEHVETLTSRIADLEEETEDLFNALNTEKASGNELYIEDAKPCRVINAEIGGMYKQETTSGKNLLEIVATSQTINGITFTINKDKTVTVNGTANGNSILILNSFDFQNGETYILNGCPNNGGINSYKLDAFGQTGLSNDIGNGIDINIGGQRNIRIVSFDGNSVNNLVYKPVIIKGSQATEYEPYTGAIASPNPDYKQEIEQVESVKLQCTGSNLLDYTKILSTPSTTSGITIKLEANGNITISGKPKYSYFSVIQSKNIVDILKDGETYYLDQSNYNRYFYTEIQAVKGDGSITYIGPQKSCASFKVNKSLFKKYVIRIIGGSLTNWGEEERTVTSNFKLTRQKNLPFEKYIEKTVNIDLKGNKLCAISDTIKDKLLIDKNGNVALQKNVDKISTNESTFTLKKATEAAEGYSAFYSIGFYNIIKMNGGLLCNYFQYAPYDGNGFKIRTSEEMISDGGGYRRIYFRVKTERLETDDESGYKKFLTDNNIIIYHSLETSELIDLGQIPELPKTFEGINNIWAETNLGNTEIEIEYVQDVKKLLEQQNARLDNIEALLSTTETSALLLDNMQTDLESEVK